MAIEIIAQVLEYSQSRLASRLVLLAIANYADENGNAYPSVETIAKRAMIGERQVRRCLRQLELLGELSVQKEASQYGTNLYCIKNFRRDDILSGGSFKAGGQPEKPPKPSYKPIDSNESILLPEPKNITAGFVNSLRVKYSEAHGDEWVMDTINAALNHKAYKNAINKELYLSRWLARDAKGITANGWRKPRSNQTILDSEERWSNQTGRSIGG